MDMTFDRHPACHETILFVMTLDRKRMKERILIGEEQQVREHLSTITGGDVLCDITRPLGAFLVDFIHDPKHHWQMLGVHPLWEALHSNRWKQPGLEKEASSFLEKKFETGDPLSMYIAFRIWNDYLIAREPADRKSAALLWVAEMDMLMSALYSDPPVPIDRESEPEPIDSAKRFLGTDSEKTKPEVWYPDRNTGVECAVVNDSLYPLQIYYLNRLKDWGLYFRKCKSCGKIFLAENQRYTLCSEKCRRNKALQSKRDFDARAKDNRYDLLYKNECQNWRNKINKAKKDNYPQERIEGMLAAFDVFKREALVRKKAVKEKGANPQEFMDWLYEQSNLILDLMDA